MPGYEIRASREATLLICLCTLHIKNFMQHALYYGNIDQKSMKLIEIRIDIKCVSFAGEERWERMEEQHTTEPNRVICLPWQRQGVG